MSHTAPLPKAVLKPGSALGVTARVVIDAKALRIDNIAPKPPVALRKAERRSLKQLLAELTDDDLGLVAKARGTFHPSVLRGDSPARPADWPWQLALMHLAARREPAGMFKNVISPDTIRLAVAAVVHEGDDSWLDRLRVSDELFEAWHLFAGPNQSLRHAFESRILVGQSVAETKTEFGFAEDFQARYERLFFDVRDRLQFRGWVINGLIGRPEDATKPEDAVRRIEKAFCYWGGRHVADYFLHQRVHGAPPTSSVEVMDYLQGDAFETLQRQAAIAARLMKPADPRHAKQLIRLQQFAASTKAQAAKKEPSIDIMAFCRGVPLAVAALPPAARASFEAFLKERDSDGLGPPTKK